MAGIMPTSANEFIEQQLNERLLALEQSFDADALCIVGGLFGGVDDFIRNVLAERRQRGGSRRRLLVLLTTNGGYIERVQRIVETLRHHYRHVSFVIPNYAFSAGTILVMSGDEIHMDYYSRLGPVDPQVPSARGRWVPALGYLIRWEKLLEKAQSGTLTLPEAQLMIEGFDQAELYQYEQARELSVTLLKEWLVKYKFRKWTRTLKAGKTVTVGMRQQRAEEIARALNDPDRWHSHGYGISMEVLRRDLKLQIDDLDDNPERCDKVKQYDGLLSDYMQKLSQTGVVHTVGRYLPLMLV
jgi:Serine dehydrogenase proteinase